LPSIAYDKLKSLSTVAGVQLIELGL